MKRSLAVALTLLGLSGCLVEDEEDITELDLEEEAQAGTASNGTSVNGTSINGTSINGTSINGTSINGTSINGTSINGVAVTGGQLTGVSSTGSPLSGSQFVGVLLTGYTNTGAAVRMRIDSATAVKVDQWAYGVSVQSGTSWVPLCGTGVQAYAVPGLWDYRTGVAGAGGPIADATKFTWACRTKGALAKCIDLGYAPWRTVSGKLLRDHHTACVRMIRADYCGDGVAWTQTGNPINVYDALGIQTDTQAWPLDAEWVVAGARCIRKTRTFQTTPSCFSRIGTTTCGTTSTSLMVSEYLMSGSTTTTSGGI